MVSPTSNPSGGQWVYLDHLTGVGMGCGMGIPLGWDDIMIVMMGRVCVLVVGTISTLPRGGDYLVNWGVSVLNLY